MIASSASASVLRPAPAPRRTRQPASSATRTSCQPVAVALRDPEGQVVEELVGEHDAGELERREIVERDEHRTAPATGSGESSGAPGERTERFVGRFEPEPLALLAPGARPRARRARNAARARTRAAARSTSREPAVAGAGLDHDERIGLVELVPAPIEGAGDARAEQRTNLGAGDEIAPGATRP